MSTDNRWPPTASNVWFRGFCGGVFVELRVSKADLSSAQLASILKMISMVRDWTVEDERALMTEDYDPC